MRSTSSWFPVDNGRVRLIRHRPAIPIASASNSRSRAKPQSSHKRPLFTLIITFVVVGALAGVLALARSNSAAKLFRGRSVSVDEVTSAQRPQKSEAIEPRGETVRRNTYPNLDVRVGGQDRLSRIAGARSQTVSDRARAQAAAIQKGLARLRASVPSAEAELSPITGAVEVLRSARALTGPNPGRAGAEIVREFIEANNELYGLTKGDIDKLNFIGESVNRVSGLRMVRVEQVVNGLPVFQSESRFILDRDGRVVRSTGLMIPKAGEGAPSLENLLSAQAALRSAMASVEISLDVNQLTLTERSADGTKVEVVANSSQILGNVPSKLVYFPLAPGVLIPAWSQITFTDGDADWYTLVDATNGEPLWRKNIREYVSTHAARFSVYVQADGRTPADSPAPQSPTTAVTGGGTQFAEILRTTVNMLTVQDILASPNGWINDCLGGVCTATETQTIGNNVHAYLDRTSNNVPDTDAGGVIDGNGKPTGNPDGSGRNRDFFGTTPRNYSMLPPPQGGAANAEVGQTATGAGSSGTNVFDAYRRGAITQLFYVCNWYHDRLFTLGFDEAAGNFQQTNFSGMGVGNDRVLAEAQDGGSTNNANFSTAPDGTSGRAQMYIFTGPTIDRDGDLDSEILVHELAHGTSNRLIGNAAGLSWSPGRSLGEGWSDFYALSLLNNTNADDPNGTYASGGYATYKAFGVVSYTDNYVYGIRRFPYSTNNSINPMTWADVDDVTNSLSGGIAADPLGFNSGGALEVHNAGEIWALTLWEVRSRIIAANANDVPTGNSKMLSIATDAMKMTPLNPSFTAARDALIDADCAANACANEQSIWDGFADRGLGYNAIGSLKQEFGWRAGHIGIGESFLSPYLDFQSVTIDDSLGNNNGAIDPGEAIKITVGLKNPWRRASKGIASATATLTSATAGVVITDGNSTYPAIAAQGSANGDTFSFSVSGTATCGQSLQFTITPTSTLGSQAVNFVLRVGASAGTGAPVTYTRSALALAITDGAPRGVIDTLNITDDFEIADVNVRVDSLTHTWDGDVTFMVKGPNGYGTDLITATGGALSQFGSSGDNFTNTLIDDQASNDLLTATNAQAPYTGSWIPAFNGTAWDAALAPHDPVGRLSRFNGTSTQGTWRVLVSDQFTPDPGTLNSWSLIVTPKAFTCTSNTAPTISAVGVTRQQGSPSDNATIANTNDLEDLETALTVTVNGGASATVNGVTVSGIAISPAGVVTADVIADCPAPTATFTLRVTDTGGLFNEATLTVTVNPNTAPTLTYATPQAVLFGGALNVSPTATGDNGAVTYSVQAGHGLTTSPTVDASGVVSITSAQPAGAHTITTRATDNCGAITDAAFTLDVGNTPPTLGNYPDTTVQAGANTTVTPDAAPTSAASMNVSTTSAFRGTFAASPTTGVVQVTNAQPAGTYAVIVTAFNSVGGTTTKTFTLTVTTPATCNPVSFASATNFGVSTHPDSVVVGDFNGDGQQDLAVANHSSNNVSILLGMGMGSFGAATNFGVGNGPLSVAVGDFNGDGQQDLATANDFSGNVSILLGTGTGSFGTATNIGGVGSYPLSVAIGDFNDDAQQDLAVDNGAGIVILLGMGTGSFGAATTFGAGDTPLSVAVGDFNGDGKQDLAAANRFSYDVSILLGTGTGSFGAPTNFAVGYDPLSLAVGDFNGDGQQDLATANEFSDVSILLGTGTGSFGAATNFAVGGVHFSLAVGDFDGDGQQDLATTNQGSNNVSILLGTGTGSFGAATNFGVGSTPRSVAVGDFNGDGKQDLATANLSSNNVSVLLRQCQPTLSISSSATQTEGDSGQANMGFTVTLSSTTSQTVTVNYSTANGSVNPALGGGTCGGTVDYVTTTGTLTFNPSDTTKTIDVPICGDTKHEPDERFTVTLDTPTNAAITSGTSTGTIADNDLPTFAIDDVTHNEGNAGTTSYTFTVTKTGSTDLSATANFQTQDNSATTADNDYQAQSGTFTFLSTDTTKQITVLVNGDTVSEADEAFTVHLSGASGATITDADGAGSITNDDSAPTFAIDDVTHNEGNAGTTSYTFTVTKTGSTALNSSVNFTTVDGSATIADNDYQSQSGTLTFLPTDTTKTITILVNGDTTFEADETFAVQLSGASGATISDADGTGTITNDDSAPAIAIDDVTQVETNSGTTSFVFTVTKGGGTALNSSVNYSTLDGSATTVDNDYQAQSGTLTFLPADTTRTISVLVDGDTAFEPDEAFTVHLSGASGATISDADGAGTITNDDSVPATLGNYPDTTVQAGANTTVTPDAVPTNTTSMNVSTASAFKGMFAASPTTGVVQVTNAHPAGTYPVTITAFNSAAGTTTKTFTLTVTNPMQCDSLSFNGALGSPFTVLYPRSMAVGDFNGDGKQDLTTANYNIHKVTVLLGNGSGGFSAVSGSPFAVGSYPSSVAVGDFNGDGTLDLSTANEGSINVTVLLGDGSGGFTEASGSPFAVDISPLSVAVGDFNGDGKLDLTTANDGLSNVTVLLGNGSGGFSPAGGSPFAVGTWPQSVVVGDFNGDGKLDLSTANGGSNNVTVLLGNGSGGFTEASGSPFAVGSFPYSVAVGDFNGDGKLDLTTANLYSDNVTVLLGDGSGGFSGASGSPFVVGDQPESVAVGDFNGDGKEDLTTANSNSRNVTVLLGNGSGGFSDGNSSPFAVASAPLSVAVGDFNGDGKLDLTTTNFSSKVTVLLNTCGPPPTLGNYPDTTVQAGANTTVTPDASPTNTASMNVSTTSAFKGAFAANPATGVVQVTNAQPAGTYPVTVMAFNSAGVSTTKAFTLTVTNPMPCGYLSFSGATGSPFGVAEGPWSVAVGDFNGDGKQDLATANFISNNVTVLLGDGSGGFSAANNSPFAVGSIPYSVAVGDFNGDGKLDITTANAGSSNVTVLLGNGSGGFSPASGSPFDVGIQAFSVAVGDLNGDGRQDLATASAHYNSVAVLLGDGRGGFRLATGSPFAVGSYPYSVAVGDFNGDGKLDLTTANWGSSNVTVLLGNGSGGFSPASGSPFAVGSYPYSVAVGDFNGDGKQDLTTANYWSYSNNATVLLGDGSGGFSEAGGSPFAVGSYPTSVAVGDLNGDGKLDITTANRNSNDVTVLLGNGSGGFSPASTSPFAVGAQSRSVAMGDFNGDGKLDLTTANYASNDVTVLLNTCSLNTAPTISAVAVSRQQGSPSANAAIANVNDLEDPETALTVTVNGGASAIVNGVTVSAINVDATGVVTANVGAGCAATLASFTLRVTDPLGVFNEATLTVTVTPNTAPWLTYATPQAVVFGGSLNLSPATTGDNGAVSYSLQPGHGLTTSPSVDASGVVSITDAKPAGAHTITIRATDTCGVFADAAFTLNVAEMPTVAIDNVTHSEGNAGTTSYTFAVTKTGSTAVDSAVNFTTVDGAATTVDSDYQAQSGTLTFSPTDTTKTITILVNGDTTFEPDETFTVHLSGASDATIINADGIGTITNDDVALGNYSDTTVQAGANTSVIPDAAPTNSTRINVSTTSAFRGIFTASPTTGVVYVTNAQPAGTYTVTVTAFSSVGATTTKTFTLTVTNPEYCDFLRFSTASGSPFAAGSFPNSMAVGDFNGDGKQDLTTTNQGSDNLTVLLGDGSGGFSAASGSPFAVGDQPESVAVGDFNGDGRLDLTTANLSSDNVTVLLGDGSGGFIAAIGSPFSVGHWPRSVAVGDFNGDGRLDLATASSNVTVLLGDGLGGFSPAPGSPFAVGSFPQSVAVGDFNGDGKLDLTTANYNSNNVTVLLGNGSGGFSPASGSPFAVGTYPLSVAVGDFNSDGKPDLTTANASVGTSTVTVLMGNGLGGFSPASGSPFSVGSGPRSVAVGDFNGDGRLDLTTANNSAYNVTVLLGNGSGGFSPASGSPFAVASYPGSVATGDFNGDGRLDLTTATHPDNVTVLLNTCTMNTAPSITAVAVSRQQGSPSANATIANVNDLEDLETALTVTLNGGVSATVNGVTVSGISVSAPGVVTADVIASCTATTATFTLRVTDTLGLFNEATLTVTVNPNTAPTLTYASPQAVVFGGALNVSPTSASDNGTVTYSVQSGHGLTTPPTVDASGVVAITNAQPSGAHTITIRATDNCGAFTDAAFTLDVGAVPTFAIDDVAQVETNSGTTSFVFTVTKNGSTALNASVNFQTQDGTATTSDNDYQANSGTLDFLPTDTTKQITVLVNGDTTFEADEAFTVHLSGASGATISDVDGTGTITNDDVAPPTLGNYPGTTVQTGANATVTPDAAPTSVASMNVSTTSAFKGTFAANPTTGVVMVTNAHPAGTYLVIVTAFNSAGVTTTKTFTLTVTNPDYCDFLSFSGASGSPFAVGASPYSVAVGDFNGDGKQDLATTNATALNVTLLLGDGSGGFTAASGSPFAIGSSPRSAAVGDFNGDGKLDLSTANNSSNSVTVLLGNGSGGFIEATGSPFAVGTGPFSVGVGDFNSDRMLDLVTANFNSNNVTVLLGDGIGGFSEASGSPFALGGSFPQSAGVGDFNADGKLDLTTANYGSNNVSVLLGDGSGGFNSAGGSPFSVGQGPLSVAVGDFNGDGKPDLTTANHDVGNVTVLLGDGSGGFNAASGSPFTVGPNPTGPWSVAVGDFNGDGKLDLTTANSYSDNVTVLLGNGSGGFNPTASPFAVGSDPRCVASGDFNGDGKLDLTTANRGSNNVTVLVNTCTLNAAPTISAVGLTRQQGSPSANATIANVNDLEDPETALTVTVNGGSSATVNDVTVSGISVDAAGVVTADVVADCTAATATFTLRVTDTGGLFNEAMLTVAVNPNTAPTLTYSSPQSVVFGGSLNVSPTTTGDNGAVTYSVQPGHGLTTEPTVDASGVVSITNAQPAGAHTVTIRATDNCGAFTDATFTLDVGEMPTFAVDDVTHNEGNTGTTSYVFTVTKTGSTALNSSVNFATVDGSATLADNDYQTNSGTLDFASTDTTKQITVLVNGDTTFEATEGFTVHLSNPSGATIGDADGTGTITNDDSTLASISGHVSYAGGSTPGKNVTMTLTGTGGFVTQMTTTNASGDYSIVNIPLGNDYTLTPSKTGDNGNGLQSFDAAFAARYVAGLDIPTAMQRIAADADGDGILTSLDAAFIARRAAGLPGSGIVGTWKFSPVDRAYPALGADQTGQNFTAILVGDTSGDWTPTLPSGGGGDNANQSGLVVTSGNLSPDIAPTVNVSLPHVTFPIATNFTVPITVGDLTGQGVKAYDLQITFNPAIVQPQGTPFDTAGTRSSTMLITPNALNPGHLIISAFQATDLTGSGTLINLKFTIVGAPGQVTSSLFQDYTDPGTIFHPGFRFNAGTPTAVPTNGSIHVNGPTAASARISGQIVTSDGQPLSGATVTVMGGAGTVRAITNSNGFYQVENLEAGGFYTVTPSRANFAFAPANRSFSLVGDKTDAVFTGMPINPEGNPLESPEFFVRQQYLDFFSREPDQGGLEYWSAQLRSCGNDAYCIETRRLDISAAFFIAQEFQDSGLYIYDVYQGALGRRPDYAEYSVDRRLVVGGPRLEADKTAFAESFVERAEFNAQYPLTMSDEVFVDALLRTAQQSSGIDLSNDRAALINLYNTGATATESRSMVVRSVAEGSRFRQTQYNPAFVLMEYYGYLGRNPDGEGYDFWLTVLNSGDRNNYRGMVCSFITSAEYQRRFSSVVTRSNAECERQ
jgi:subtilisin-like proprotein convertase family protein